MSYDSVPTHPIPPRLLNGPEVPYIGPNIEAYRKAHAETVGENADKWWAKVCRNWNTDKFLPDASHIDGKGVASLGYPFPHRQDRHI